MISILRLWIGAEVEEVIGWAEPADVLARDCDFGLRVNGRFKLSNGIDCPVFGHATEGTGGVEVWSADSLIRWDLPGPQIYKGFEKNGERIKKEVRYRENDWREPTYLTGAMRSFIAAVENGSELWISGYDLGQALEVAIASQVSAKRGNVPMKLPLEDRSLTLYPNNYRWLGGDHYTYPRTPATKEEKVVEKRQDLDV